MDAGYFALFDAEHLYDLVGPGIAAAKAREVFERAIDDQPAFLVDRQHRAVAHLLDGRNVEERIAAADQVLAIEGEPALLP